MEMSHKFCDRLVAKSKSVKHNNENNEISPYENK